MPASKLGHLSLLRFNSHLFNFAEGGGDYHHRSIQYAAFYGSQFVPELGDLRHL